jgi:hypothetical protein
LLKIAIVGQKKFATDDAQRLHPNHMFSPNLSQVALSLLKRVKKEPAGHSMSSDTIQKMWVGVLLVHCSKEVRHYCLLVMK